MRHFHKIFSFTRDENNLIIAQNEFKNNPLAFLHTPTASKVMEFCNKLRALGYKEKEITVVVRFTPHPKICISYAGNGHAPTLFQQI